MLGFALARQRPPEARRIKHDVVMRFDHVYEVAPELMQTFPQQDIPAWDTLRIVASRWDHLAWMHDHWADSVLGVEQLEAGETGEPEAAAEGLPSREQHVDDAGAGI